MAKTSAAAAPESRSRRGARPHAVRLLFSIHHRFLRLLSATTPKSGRRTAKSARKVARPRKPNSLRAADEEEHEQDVEAWSPEAWSSDSAATVSEEHEQDVEAWSPEPWSPDSATTVSEEHEQDVEARSPDSTASASGEHEQDVEARSPDAAATATDASASEAAVAGKYWAHRYSLFNLYDRGVRMDAEGWYSTTPESIAASQAARAAPGDLVVDAFAGCGGNSIQFAARGCYVIAVEIDPRKVELAKHNARVYGVEDRIQFIVGDFFRVAPFLKADWVFLSPPWGGPSYIEAPVYTLDMLQPKDGYATFQAAQKIAPSIMMFLPRTVDVKQVEELSWLSSPPLDFESEENYVDHRFKGITAYFGRR